MNHAYTLQSLLDEVGTLILDGAMGTELMAAGLEQGDPPETWNTERPATIEAIHQAYVDAGARVLLTNSFGGNRFRLALHGLEGRVAELNEAAARRARVVADRALHPVLVAGSIGPSGELIVPLGTLEPEAAREGFAAQAAALAAGGADLLWIETMSDLAEVEAALAGARDATDLPVVVTLSFDTRGHTMMGVSPERAVERLVPLGPAAIGANCGNGLDEVDPVIERLAAAGPGIPIVSKVNAGIPRWEGSELVYDGTPEKMAEHARRVAARGATLIGGCCGSTPTHIRAIADALGVGRPQPSTG